MEVRFVAEVSSNHGRNLDRSLAFVETASRIGCAAVKFQLFRVDELFAPEILAKSETHRARKQWELPEDHIAPLAWRCIERGIEFSCTPFFLDAVDMLDGHVAFYKIASYELLWGALLEKCGRTGKPVVISSGMATLGEIESAVTTLKRSGCRDMTVLHCVSAYPTPTEQANLSAIDVIRDRVQVPVGWSDHTRSPAVIE